MAASKSFEKRIEHTKKFVDNTHGLKAMSWCIKRGITIYAVPLPKVYTDGSKYPKNWCKIEINNQGVKKLGKQWYTQKQLRDAILDLYIQIYRRG
tara:strand:- start:155 stop:439 length:285 start_codon:yes stop_codon:yes gene_type:complete